MPYVHGLLVLMRINTDFLQKNEDSSYLKGLLNKWLLFYGMEIINLYVSVNLYFGWVLFS